MLGASGGGKTVAVKKVLENSPKIFDVNSAHGDPRYTPVTWEEVNSKQDCAIVADDVFDLSTDDYKHLHKLLNYTARHNRVSPVILVAHGVTKINLYSIIKHMDEIWFTLNKQNAPTIGSVCTALMFSRSVKNNFIAKFLAESGEYGIFVLDTQKRTFERLFDSPGGEDGGGGGVCGNRVGPDLEPYKRTAEAYFPHFCVDPARSLLIFNYIIAKLPLASVDSTDLTIKLMKKDSGVELKLSLLDYILALTNESKPASDITALHRYVEKHVQLPRCFVRNRLLKK